MANEIDIEELQNEYEKLIDDGSLECVFLDLSGRLRAREDGTFLMTFDKEVAYIYAKKLLMSRIYFPVLKKAWIINGSMTRAENSKKDYVITIVSMNERDETNGPK